ncbi:signal peptidase I [Leucobacter coleopterorum]|uniref:Signal peptidase I n=1 Tax=Leucobacter coleopterorum TaxID=2714933 RepID=A0ABX6JYA7_9MICO|nr:signal peptidase I [Leucobacter coleopterorum]QIM17929.1 signal peptidase I [Leucobacter coleopterorum]
MTDSAVQQADQPADSRRARRAADRATSSRRGVRATFRAFGTGLTFGLLLLFVGIGIATIVVPAVTGSTALTVRTSSMEPALPPGTMVVVRPTQVSDIRPGMVLTYQLNSGKDTLVTHRVTQKQFLADGSPVFVTKGDANPQPDPAPVQEVQIRGTVWYAIPYVGWVTAVFTGQSKAIAIAIAVGGLLTYAAWMVVSSLRDRARKKPTS